MTREAIALEPGRDGRVECRLCAHRCVVAPGKLGVCAVRENRGGRLETLCYGEVVAAHVDPIEKKPLYHFFPGSKGAVRGHGRLQLPLRLLPELADLAVPAPEGGRVAGEPFPPEAVVRAALDQGCRSISYTYTEPTIFLRVRLRHRQAGPRGRAGQQFRHQRLHDGRGPWRRSALSRRRQRRPQAFEDKTYKKVCGACLGPVLESIRRMSDLGIWVRGDDPGRAGPQ